MRNIPSIYIFFLAPLWVEAMKDSRSVAEAGDGERRARTLCKSSF